MSGPIVRKYGFPNFDKIFGKRELEHGVDSDEGGVSEAPEAKAKPAKADKGKKRKSSGKKKQD